MSDEKKVVTLLAEKGKKYDEDKKCISSYDGSIVFLPADVLPGAIVRVLLHEVEGKTDARGSVMYFARHAPATVSDTLAKNIHSEAKMLHGLQHFNKETARALLGAKYGSVIEAWRGYAHYYLDDSGAVYGSCFSPASLTLFECFATGQVATEPLLWIADGMKQGRSSLYSMRERGEEIEWRFSVPQLTDAVLERLEESVAAGKLLLADPLIEVARGMLRSSGWEEHVWQNAEKPDVTIPDYENEPGVKIPDIFEFEYGRSLSGSSLVGFGVIGTTSVSWYQDRKGAEAQRDKAIEKLAGLKEAWALRDSFLPEIKGINEAREVVSLPKLEAKSEGFTCWGRTLDYTQENLDFARKEVKCKKVFDDLSAQREELGLSALSIDSDGEFDLNGYKKLIEENLDLVRQSIADEKERLEQVRREEDEAKEQAEADAKVKRETIEHEAALTKAVECGEVMRDFHAYVRRSGSRQGDGWVIAPDGSLREPDEVDHTHPSSFRYSHKIWQVVKADELALTWSDGTDCEVIHHATEYVPTPAQLEKVREIEEEVGLAPGSFGFDPKATAEREKLRLAIEEACRDSKVLTSVPKIDCFNVIRDDGQEVYEEHVAGGDSGWFVNHAEPFDVCCENRHAQVVETLPIGEGVVELLTYEKFGRWNLNLRYQKRHFDVSEKVGGTMEDKLAALKAKFG